MKLDEALELRNVVARLRTALAEKERECERLSEALDSEQSIATYALIRAKGAEAALEPFATGSVVFGADWADADELAVEPFDERGGVDLLLFTLKVGDFRRARAALKDSGNV